MPTLYSLTQEYRRLLDSIEEAEGEISPEVEQHLAALEFDTQAKVDGYCRLIRELEAAKEARAEEAKRLSKEAAKVEAAIDRLKRRLLESMQTTGRDRLDGSLFSVRLRTNSPKVISVFDAAALYKEWSAVVKMQVSYALDKEAIHRMAKQGEPLPPGVAIVREQRIEIK